MKQKKTHSARNPFHDHPLLRKGGPHEKSRKAQRRAHKASMRREWDPQSASSRSAVPVLLAA